MKERKWLLKLEYYIQYKEYGLILKEYKFEKKIKDYPSKYIGLQITDDSIAWIEECRKQIEESMNRTIHILKQSFKVTQSIPPVDTEDVINMRREAKHDWFVPALITKIVYELKNVIRITPTNITSRMITEYDYNFYLDGFEFGTFHIDPVIFSDLKYLQDKEFIEKCQVNTYLKEDGKWILDRSIVVEKPKFRVYQYSRDEYKATTEMELLSVCAKRRWTVPLKNVYYNLMGEGRDV